MEDKLRFFAQMLLEEARDAAWPDKRLQSYLRRPTREAEKITIDLWSEITDESTPMFRLIEELIKRIRVYLRKNYLQRRKRLNDRKTTVRRSRIANEQ